MNRLLYVFPEPIPLPKARGIQVVKTIAALSELGYMVDFAYVPVPAAADPFAYYGVAKPQRVRLIPILRSLPWPLDRLGKGSNKFFLWRLLSWLREDENQNGAPQCIFVRHLKLADGLLRKLPQLPLIYEAHEVFSDTAPAKKKLRLARVEKRVLAGASQLISISGALAEALRQRYGVTRHITIIPSAADLQVVKSDKDWSIPHKHIVYSGSFFPWKGVDDLVLAAAYLPADCTISIIGGDLKGVERLKRSQPNGGAKIEYMGPLTHAESLAVLARSCIAILPNRAESVSAYTSPLKLFEYMAAGCAIVASDLPVFREVLGQEDASWFDAGNPEALANAIRGLLDNKVRAQCMGQRLREQVGKYSWSGRAQAISNLLSELKDGHAPKA